MRILTKRRSFNKNRARTRTILLEQLEDRRVLYSPWQNPARPLDVDNDQTLSPLDALVLINRINTFGSGALPMRTNPLDYYYDVDGDSQLTPLDVLQVINALNSGASGGLVFPNPGNSEVAPAGFISIPLARLPGSHSQIVNIEAQLTIRKREFNEMGLFVVDDYLGRVNGLLPSHPEYPLAVWQSASRRVLYSRSDTFDFTTQLSLPAASHVRVYVLQSATSDGTPESHLRVRTLAENQLRIGWEQHAPMSNVPTVGDRGFDDAIVDLTLSPPVTSNATPFISFIPNQTHPEETLFTYQVVAGDPNLPIDTLTFTLDAAPPGLSIIPNTGVLSWAPSEANGPGTYGVTVRVTDAAGAFAIRSFTISVLEVNRPPILSSISNSTLTAGQSLTIHISASDPDIPDNRLTYSLRPGAPTDASIDPATGLFRWTAPSVLSSTTFPITVRVTDDGSPNLFDEKSFTITVLSDWIEIVEDDRFVTEHRFPITLANGIAHLETTFSRLHFDRTDTRRMRDAFEIALLDSAGRPVVGTIAPDRDALFNQTDSQPPLVAPGTHYDITDVGPADIGGRITIDVSHLPDGFTGELVLRLVNNDSDDTTRVSILPSVTQIPGSKRSSARFSIDRPFSGALDRSVRAYYEDEWSHLSHITPAIDIVYDWTAYDTDTQTVIAGLTLTNRSEHAIRGPVLITVDRIESLTASLTRYAGMLPWDTSRYNDPAVAALARSPFLDATPALAPVDIFVDTSQFAWEPGQSFRFPLEFHQPTLERFDYRVQVLGTINRPPQFTTVPITTVALGNAYAYDSQASDPDRDNLHYTLVSGPSGLVINSVTGQVTWTPTASQVGTHPVTLRTTDPWGAYNTQTYTISVSSSALNRPPVFVTTPVVDAYAGIPYAYPSRGTDPDLDALTYSILVAPSGMAIEAGPAPPTDRNNPAGNVSWTPTADHIGQFVPVSLHVDDGRGGMAIQSYEIYVQPNPNNRPPIIVTEPQSEFRIPLLESSPSQGAVDPKEILELLAFGQIVTRNVTLELPPGKSLNTADIVLVVDESGSMEEQSWIASMIRQLESSLIDVGVTDNQYALVGFGSWSVAPRFVTDPDNPWANAETAALRAGALLVNGGIEDGYWGIDYALQNLEFRPNSAKHVILLTDEDRDVEQSTITRESLSEKLLASGIALHAVVAAAFYPGDAPPDGSGGGNGNSGGSGDPGGSGDSGDPGQSPDSLGVWPTTNAQGESVFRLFYPLADGQFETLGVASYTARSSDAYNYDEPYGDTTVEDYVEMVDQLGGTNWNIFMLRQGATQSFTSAFVSTLSEIISQQANVGLRPVATTSAGLPSIDIGQPSIADRQITFPVTFYGDGDAWDFDLEFFDTQLSNQSYGYIPVALAAGYHYDILAIDPDGDEIEYSMTRGAEHGAQFDPNTRKLLWSPTLPGEYQFTLMATDPWGASDVQTWTIQVAAPTVNNFSPIIEPIPDKTQEAGRAFAISVSANDPNGDSITYGLLPGATTGQLPPAGLILDPISGLIAWRPANTDLGVHEITVQAVDGRGGRAVESFSVNVVPRLLNNNSRPVITSQPNTMAPVGVRYRYEVTAYDADGDALAFFLAVAPEGMVIDRLNGIVSWNPDDTQISVHPVVVRVTDEVGGVVLQAFQVTVVSTNDPPTITNRPSGPAVPGQLWSYPVTATDPNGDTITFSLLPGQFPTGAAIDPQTGLLTWTPSANGAYRFVVVANDGRGGIAQQEFLLPVSDAAPPEIISNPTGPARLGHPYQYLVIATDPNPRDTVTLTLDETSIARGITLTAQTCPSGTTDCTAAALLQWTPIRTDPIDIAVTATDSIGNTFTQSFILNVIEPPPPSHPPRITSLPTGPAILNQLWTYPVTATDPDNDPITFRLGTHPSGMTIHPTTGLVSWTPTATTDGTLVEVIASDPHGAYAQQSFVLPVVTPPSNSPGQPPRFRSIPPRETPINQSLNYRADAYDPDGTEIRYHLTQGVVGMFLHPQTGVLSWNPSWIGSVDIEITAIDADGQSATQAFTLEVIPTGQPNRPPEITSSPLGPAVRNLPYRYPVIATDPDGDPLTYALDPDSIARGSAIDSAGILTWTPTAKGSFPFTLTVSDPLGASVSQSFTLPVLANAPPRITSTPPTRIEFGQFLSYNVTAIDPNPGDTVRFSAAPREGLSIDPTSGLLTWTPTTPGSFFLSVLATDNHGARDQQTFDVLVIDPGNNQPPQITGTPRSRIQLGSEYLWQIPATDPDADPLTFSLVSGPNGLTVTVDGILRWTPSSEQVTTGGQPHAVTVLVSDGRGGSDSATWLVHVAHSASNAAPSITSVQVRGIDYPLGSNNPTPAALQHAVAGRPYQALFSATDPDGDTLVWSLVDAPAGVRIDARGLVDYRPTLSDVGSKTITVQATDTSGASDRFNYSLRTRSGNSPALIAGNPPVHHRRGTLYQTTFTATDADGDAVFFRFVPGQPNHGATLDETTGTLTWTPDTDGTYRFNVSVADPLGAGTQMVFDVRIDAFGPNDPPVFENTPPGVAEVGSTYSRRFPATDPDGDPITYAVASGPAGLTINATDGTVNWNPPVSLVNTSPTVRLTASDPAGNTAHYQFNLPVRAANRPPQFDSIPPSKVTSGAVYRYDVLASDPDFDSLTLALVSAPSGLIFDPQTGRITWTTTAADIGQHTITISLTDSRIPTPLEQTWTLTVRPDTSAPSVQIIVPNTSVDVGTELSIEVRASDDVGIAERTLRVNNTNLPLSAAGFGKFRFQTPGLYVVTATASDPSGNTTTNTLEVSVRDPNNAAPVVRFTQPTGGTSITAPTQVHLTVTDSENDLTSVQLFFAPADGSTPFRPFSSRVASAGSTLANFIDEPLGLFDPTNLPNGSYILRAIARDAGFNETIRDSYVHVEGRLKLGNFSLSFNDLTVPVAGIPITIVRKYDTLDAQTSGDFGYGWSLDIRQATVRIDASTLGGVGSGRYRAFVDGTRVFVTTPEGTEEGFTFHAIPDQSVFGIPLSWKSFFIPDAGNSYRLEAPAGGLKKLGNEYLSGFGTTYNPQDPEFGNAFQVTTFPSRIKYNVNATTGKTVSLEDRYGNRVEPHYDGLHSNRGRSVLFERDMRGRITRITDPAGHSLLYEYNAAGQLVSFYDRRATARLNDGEPNNDPTPIRFAYNLAEDPAYAGIPGAAHYLTQITDPLGVVAVQANFHPDTGRLIELVDADGQSAQIAYNIAELTVASTSASGTTEISLDRHGNPTRSVDEQGIVTLTEYSDLNRGLPNQITTIVGEPDTPEQIAAGTGDDQVVRFTFNQWGQRTSETDSRGNVSRTTYDNQGYPRQNIDVFGNSTTYTFHEDQLIGTTDHLGNSTTFGYDSFGNITHVTQSNWSVGTSTTSSMVYNTFGDIIAMTDADGNSRSMQYDVVGRQIGASYVWTDPNGILPDKTLSSTTVLGPDGQLDVSIDPRGQTSRVLYDALNRGSTQIDSTGLSSETIYDRRGLAIEHRQEALDENGNSVWFVSRTIYDAAGRAIYSTGSYTEDIFANHPEEITGTHTVYNTLGQVDRTEQLVGLNIDIVGRASNPSSLLTSPGTVISFSGAHYDDAGRVTETFNEYGLRSQTLYGQHGEVVESRTELPPATGAQTGSWLVSRTIYDNFGRAIISTDGFLVPLDTPLGEDPVSLIAPPISMRITRTVYDSQGRSIATERYTDALVTLPPEGSAQPGRAAFVLQSPGTLESVSETIYDRAGRVWRTISGRVPLSTLSPTALAQSAALANYPTHGTARDPYAEAWNLSPGVLSDTLFDNRGRQIATLGHPLPASDVGIDLTLSPFNLPSSNFLVRLRNEKVYDSLGGATVTHTGIIHIENLDGSFVKIDGSQERTRKDIVDAFGQVIETIDAVGTPLESSTKREYDDRGRVFAEIDAIGTRKEFLYNDLDQLVAVKLPAVPNPLKAGNPVEHPIYRYYYNVFGQMSKLVDANGHETKFGFDSRGQSTHRVLPDSQTESFSYDNRQRLVLHVSFEGVYKQSLYDDTPSGAGRMMGYNLFGSEQDYLDYQLNGTLPTGKLWETLRMSYDSRGRLESTIHQYWDGATVKLTDTWTNSYDSQHRLAEEASPTGAIQYEYDSLNRRIQVSAFTRKADGALEGSPTSVVKYTYDILGQLSTVITTVRDGISVDVDPIVPGDQPERTNYFYDLFGRMDYTEMPNGIVEDYSFDRLGRLDVMRHFQSDANNRDLTDNAILAVYDYEYRADGRRVGLTEKFGGSGIGFQPLSSITDAVLANSYTWTYDNAGRLIREILDSSDDSIDQTESYIMDLVGNRMRRTIDRAGTENDSTDVYIYDSSDRLLNENRYSNLTGVGTPSQTTTYDWTGTQQTSKTVSVPSVSTVVQSMFYGLRGQLEKVVTTTSDGSDTVTGRTQVEYRYDPRGIRFIATDYVYNFQASDFELRSSTEYLIDHHNFTGYAQTILETSKNAEGQITKQISYTFGHDEITQTVSEIDPSSGSVVSTETHAFGHDGKGSTRVLLDSAAAIAQIFTYSAYGELLGLHNALGQNLTTLVSPLTSVLYNGEAIDARTGLYNMRARWYSPSNARWERLDPFAGNPNDPFSFHKYGFVHGDPITGIDPSGLSFITQIPFAFGITGGLIGAAAGATIAFYSGTSIFFGMFRGMIIGTLAGIGLAYGGIWLVGYAGWLGSVLLSIVASEGLFFSLLASMKAAELNQKGPPPTAERARHDYDYARLSLSIYDGARVLRDAVESDGWEVIDGIGGEDRFYSYRSRLYKHDSRRELVMVYEGSTPSLSHFGDWANNFQQGTTMMDAGWQYTRAKRDAIEAVEMAERLGYKITMTGHSLGGGLATASALHTRQKAVTFNAAGVNRNTTRTSGASRLITNYRVQGEFLSTLQDSPFFGWFLPNSSAGTTYWLRGRSDSPIARHTDDILQGMEDFF